MPARPQGVRSGLAGAPGRDSARAAAGAAVAVERRAVRRAAVRRPLLAAADRRHQAARWARRPGRSRRSGWGARRRGRTARRGAYVSGWPRRHLRRPGWWPSVRRWSCRRIDPWRRRLRRTGTSILVGTGVRGVGRQGGTVTEMVGLHLGMIGALPTPLSSRDGQGERSCRRPCRHPRGQGGSRAPSRTTFSSWTRYATSDGRRPRARSGSPVTAPAIVRRSRRRRWTSEPSLSCIRTRARSR